MAKPDTDSASQMTITEALQEIKTINKRIEIKRRGILTHLAQDVRIKDPLLAEGGSAEWVRRERQAVGDLCKRIVKIRTEIQKSNLLAYLTIGLETMTVAEWLTWRREIAEGHKNFQGAIIAGIQKLRNEAQKQGGRVVGHNVASVSVEQTAPPEVVVYLDEARLMQDQEDIEKTLGTLDGKLSLFNATTVIELF